MSPYTCNPSDGSGTAIRARPVDPPASARHRRPVQPLRRRPPRMVVERGIGNACVCQRGTRRTIGHEQNTSRMPRLRSF